MPQLAIRQPEPNAMQQFVPGRGMHDEISTEGLSVHTCTVPRPHICTDRPHDDAKFKDYLDPVRSDHPHLFGALKRATGISFNPFALM